MNVLRTVADVIASLPKPNSIQLEPPPYIDKFGGRKVALGVESMRRHMTDEGWQIMLALQEGGYRLAGRKLRINETDVNKILDSVDNVGTLAIQDKREWEGRTAGPGFNIAERFSNVHVLKEKSDIFKLTILKDSQHNPTYHREAAEEMGCHAWIVYYHPQIVNHLAPYTRLNHLVRTYHSLDSKIVPDFNGERSGCILSGAISNVYPLRQRLVQAYKARKLPETIYIKHPGYGRDGCHTPDYLELLSRFKVAICTSSIYGYALRKIIEATACGCVVITDLPVDEVLPEIDDNLVRVNPNVSNSDISMIIRDLCGSYSSERQLMYAEKAKKFYDYKYLGNKLANDIERLRLSYNGAK